MGKPFRVTSPGKPAGLTSDESSLVPVPAMEPSPLGMAKPESPDPLMHPHSRDLGMTPITPETKPFKNTR